VSDTPRNSRGRQSARGQKDLAAALIGYRVALAIQEGHAAEAPANGGLQRDLSVHSERVADMQAKRGDVQAAHAGCTRALKKHA